MNMRRWARPALAGALLTIGVSAGATPAQAPSLQALTRFEPGQWQLKESAGGRTRDVCVSDPRILLQLRHGANTQCSRFVIENQPLTGTVHYTCAGAGHGRTTIRIESARLAHIHTQGLANGLPFEADIEARRIGACA